jgi:hypothetical protein
VHVRFARAAIARVLSAPEADAGTPDDTDEVDHRTDADSQANQIIERKD